MNPGKPSPTAAPTGHLPQLVVRLAGLWILVGALFKLLLGTPADLPVPVRDFGAHFGFDAGLTYRFAIGIELALAFLGLLRPRLAWVPLALLFVVFDAVLTMLIAGGAASCGCFGAKIPVPPGVMLALDSGLLLALVLVQPWRSLGDRRPGAVVLAAALAVAIALPWMIDREAGGETSSPDGLLRPYVSLDLKTWVGRDVWDTPLGAPPLSAYTDVNALPLDGLWIFYRWTCDHCRAHLEALAESEHGERMIVLIRLAEPIDSAENRVVHVIPSGDFVVQAELPDTYDYAITTPGELLLAGGRIVRAMEAATPEKNVLSAE